MSRKCFLYEVKHKHSEKYYVGISVNPEKRWKYHKRVALSGKEPTKFYNALKAYGSDAFEWSVLIEYPSQEAARQAELEVLFTRDPDLLNSMLTDDGFCYELSDEVRKKIGAKNKGRVKTPEEIAKTNLHKVGVPRKEETKRKIGEGNKGKYVSLETREKISRSWEARVREGKVNTGTPASEERKDKLRRRQLESNFRKKLIAESGVYGPFPWVDYPDNLYE